MNTDGTPNRCAAEIPAVVLTCTSCELVYQPDLSTFTSGNTGCPRCGGWTWIAHLATSDTSGAQSW